VIYLKTMLIMFAFKWNLKYVKRIFQLLHMSENINILYFQQYFQIYVCLLRHSQKVEHLVLNIFS